MKNPKGCEARKAAETLRVILGLKKVRDDLQSRVLELEEAHLAEHQAAVDMVCKSSALRDALLTIYSDTSNVVDKDIARKALGIKE